MAAGMISTGPKRLEVCKGLASIEGTRTHEMKWYYGG